MMKGRNSEKDGVPLCRDWVVEVELNQMTWVPCVTVTTEGLKPELVMVIWVEAGSSQEEFAA